MRTDYNKLVRDRIPEIITAEGKHVTARVLDQDDYRAALRAKLLEESHEAAHATASDLPGELADVLEVVMALADAAGVEWERLLELAADERRMRGGFAQGILLEFVEDEPAVDQPNRPRSS